MKLCRSCSQTKPFSEFYQLKSDSTKYRARCKDCLKQEAANWRANLSEDEKSLWEETISEWKEQNPDSVRAHAKKWRDKKINVDDAKE